MNNALPILIIPIETKAREFYARMFIAAQAVSRGHKVLIGQSKYLHRKLSRFPRAIILENDITPQGARFIREAHEMGFAVVAWDEESIVTLTDEIFAELRVAEENLSIVKRFFCRGLGDQRAVQELYPDHADKVIATGNARLEILQPMFFRHEFLENEPQRPVILINSRYSIVNPFRVSAEKARANVIKKFRLQSGERVVQHVDGWLDHAAESFILFKDMVGRLAANFPECDIVIRPHPSEGREAWQKIADQNDNCIVTLENAAIDWILKSDVLVHSSCTTAIESALLGVKAVSYLPNYDQCYDAFLPNLVSDKYYCEDKLFEAVANTRTRDISQIQAVATHARASLAPHVAGLDEPGTSNIILDQIQSMDWTPEPQDFAIVRAKLRNQKNLAKSAIASMALNLTKEGRALRAAREKYSTQKFPPTDINQLKDVFERFGAENYQIATFAPNWWHISPG